MSATPLWKQSNGKYGNNLLQIQRITQQAPANLFLVICCNNPVINLP